MDIRRRKERVAQLCWTQQGRITRAQLNLLDVSNDAIAGWTRSGYLTRVLPRVYAVGHSAPSREADLWTAVLYAGPGAQLSHASAAHHRGLIIYAPAVIKVSTPRFKIRSIRGVVEVHPHRDVERSMCEGIPTTTVAQTLLDLAATESLKAVRRALAVLDYRRELDVRALEAKCGKGRPGSKALRAALEIHQPELAHTNSELEDAFLFLCERFGLPVPRCNLRMYGFPVDAFWPDHNLVVEVDGRDGHSSRAQVRNDRRKELTLREHGHSVVRYDWELVTGRPVEVATDLARLGVGASKRPPRIP